MPETNDNAIEIFISKIINKIESLFIWIKKERISIAIFTVFFVLTNHFFEFYYPDIFNFVFWIQFYIFLWINAIFRYFSGKKFNSSPKFESIFIPRVKYTKIERERIKDMEEYLIKRFFFAVIPPIFLSPVIIFCINRNVYMSLTVLLIATMAGVEEYKVIISK